MRGSKGRGQTKKSPRSPAREEHAPLSSAQQEDDSCGKEQRTLKPRVQADLTNEELKEEIPRVLYARNPRQGTYLVRWTHQEGTYKPVAMADQTAWHFAMEGWLVPESSEEAKKQSEVERKEREAEQELEQAGHTSEMALAATMATTGTGDEDEQQGEGGTSSSIMPSGRRGEAMIRNSFNFSERAAQAVSFPPRDKQVAAEPPKTMEVSGTVTQWAIYDRYKGNRSTEMGTVLKERKEGEQSVLGGGQTGEKRRESWIVPESESADEEEEGEEKEKEKEKEHVHGPGMERGTRVLERMACLNAHRDIAMDFAYWDDVGGQQQKEEEGTLLPLWRFQPEKAKKKHVTELRWHPEYPDLFAAAYGSFDFMKQGTGLVMLHTLKNPSHPERAYATPSGAMSVDFNQRSPSLVAVGLYDGSVQVFDARSKASQPFLKSESEVSFRQGSSSLNKHTDPVWGVRWQEDGELCFCSVSSDGRVATWRPTGAGLACDDALKLRRSHEISEEGNQDPVKDELALGSLFGGTCFDFNPGGDQVFVVGTEEGGIYECSRAYLSQLLRHFDGHTMPVYAVRWNPLHPRVFASASADWTVRVWEDFNSKAALKLDIGSPVTDVQWQPGSAGVLACCTGDGKVAVFDLLASRHEPICEQRVGRKSRLTTLAFSPSQPCLLAGDERGCVTALKLSPNLRRPAEDPSSDRLRLSRSLEIARHSGGL